VPEAARLSIRPSQKVEKVKSSNSIKFLKWLLQVRAEIRDGSQKAGYPIALAAVVFFLTLWVYEGSFPLI
ncbi:MAG: hypothetical protein NZ936_16725, partial [Alphaproteobacteria bacterium]|nr:hypothetical protein [Alphaproteobacteria bacterium]